MLAVVRLRPSIQKVKPRTVHHYSKANWDGMKEDMLIFQSTFLSTCDGKSTEQLWQEFRDEVGMIVNRYVPIKTIRGRKTLPWVTQEIRRDMNKRDHMYQVQKSSRKDDDRLLFKKVKYEVDSMIKTSYNNYLDSRRLSRHGWCSPKLQKTVLLPKELQTRFLRQFSSQKG